MLPYYPARDGYPSMFEADDDAGSAIAAPELAPAGCTSCCKSTSGAAGREVLAPLFRSIATGATKGKSG